MVRCSGESKDLRGAGKSASSRRAARVFCATRRGRDRNGRSGLYKIAATVVNDAVDPTFSFMTVD
jgi:hypothetical protein